MMDEHTVLHHLLEVEAQAAALIGDAQAEADRRLTEEEHRNRLAHEKAYGMAVAGLEQAHTEAISAVRCTCDAELAQYRHSLDHMPRNHAAFTALMDRLVAPPPCAATG